MKGIFIPLLFAIFGGRAISEGNLPTGTDPNKVAEIYANPQNTHPSKLSDAPITHERKLEVRGEEMSRSLDDTRGLPLEGQCSCMTCALDENVVKCDFGDGIKKDINMCFANIEGKLTYQKFGNFIETCDGCNVEGNNILTCNCQPTIGEKKITTISLNEFIKNLSDLNECQVDINLNQKNIEVAQFNLDLKCIKEKQELKSTLDIGECLKKLENNHNANNTGVNGQRNDSAILHKCKLQKRNLTCEETVGGSKVTTDYDLNTYIDFAECPPTCKITDAQKKSLI